MLSLKQNPCWVVFFVLFVLYCLFGLNGYGNDIDTYLMKESGQNLLLHGKYFPSRVPGYPIPEITIGATSLIGGFYLRCRVRGANPNRDGALHTEYFVCANVILYVMGFA
jgi:hypothetical protein